MDQFDDNGWNEIWELFGKDQKHSPYEDKTKNESVGDGIGFEKTGVIADTGTTCKLEITSAWPEWTNGGGRPLKSCDELECSDEIKVAGTTPQTDCQSDIYEAYDRNEDSPDGDEYDVHVQKFTDAAGDETFKGCSKDDDIGQKFTSDTTVDEILKECYSDVDECYMDVGERFTSDEIISECDQDENGENHLAGQICINDLKRDSCRDESEKELYGGIFTSENFTSETFEECCKDDDENDPAGQKLTSDAGDEIVQECDQDDGENDPGGLQLTSEAGGETCKEWYKDVGENDPVGQKLTSDAGVERFKECYKDEGENDPGELKLTSDAGGETFEEWYKNVGENDPVGEKFTSNEGDEIVQECDQDDGENDPGGLQLTSEAGCETCKEWYKDVGENDPVGQKLTSDAGGKTFKEWYKEDGENDLVGQKLTSDAGGETFEEWYTDVGENDPIREKFTSNEGDEIVQACDQDDGENHSVGRTFSIEAYGSATDECYKVVPEKDPRDETFKECYKDVGDSDPIGENLTRDAGDEMIQECYQYDGENHSAGRKFTSEPGSILGKEWYTDGAENGYTEPKFKSALKLQYFEAIGAVPNDVETGISPNEVATELDDVLPAIERRHKSHAVLKDNISAKKERKPSNGISRYKIPLVANIFQFTLSECVKASSTKLLLQRAFFFAGFFSCISGCNGEDISPQDAIAAVGTTVRFKCSWDLKKPVYWQWTSVHSQTSLFLYIGNGGLVDSADDGISIDIDRDKGRYDLVITGVLLKHAGTYTCIENSGLGRSMSAELTVLDEWKCRMDMPPGGFMGENIVNIPEDVILAFCSLHISGNKDPTIRWSISSNVSHTNATVTSKRASTITTAFSVRPTKDLDKSELIVSAEGHGDSTQTVGGHSWRLQMIRVNYVYQAKGPLQGHMNMLSCNPECSFAANAAYRSATYRYDDRSYEIPLAFDDGTPPVSEPDSKWQIMLVVSIVLFVASLSSLLLLVFYTRFKVGNAKYGSVGLRADKGRFEAIPKVSV